MRKAKRWLVFYQYEYENREDLVECCGTGTFIPVDNRLSNDTIENKVFNGEYYYPVNAVAFNICAGDDIFHLHKLTEIRFLNK